MTASDLRFALRRHRRHGAASIAATLTLALGVGAVTALFSVVRAVLLRPPPFRAPHELVAVDLHPAARPETDQHTLSFFLGKPLRLTCHGSLHKARDRASGAES